MARGGKARRKRKAKKQSNMAMLAASVERAAPVAADARERRKKKEPREPRNAPSGDPQKRKRSRGGVASGACAQDQMSMSDPATQRHVKQQRVAREELAEQPLRDSTSPPDDA